MTNRQIMSPGTESSLGLLSDPQLFHEPIDISGEDAGQLLRYLKTMMVIRKAEEKIGDMVVSGVVVGPAHLGIGQEAIAVGMAAHLRSGDSVFGTHRSHSHFLALGNDVYELFSEVIGRVTGCSLGMGGSQHLYGDAKGLMFSVPIVAAMIPIAVGAGLAAQMDGNGSVSVSHFGDGAVEEGAAQESFNLASIMNLPVVFVCENNFFASHMHIDLRQPTDLTSRFAKAHQIPCYVIDGNNIVAMSEAANKAVDRARAGKGPSYIEAVTYRWRGHVGPREDLDVGVQRSSSLALWKKRDPIGRLADALVERGVISAEKIRDLSTEVQALIDEAWVCAEKSPYPHPTALLDLVYSL